MKLSIFCGFFIILLCLFNPLVYGFTEIDKTTVVNSVIDEVTFETDTQEIFKLAKEIGISTHAHCMLGMPGDTEASIEQTINFVLEIEPTTATFLPLSGNFLLLPGLRLDW